MLIHNATIVNERRRFTGSVRIAGETIAEITEGDVLPEKNEEVLEAEGLLLLPGAIDEHVHFREPGLTHKADMESESKAAVAGGVTSFLDMPNTQPQTTTNELVEEKCALAAKKSVANYGFYLGATHENLSEIQQADPTKICGVKLFMGSSTGNMLVDDNDTLCHLFAESPLLIAVHCEDELTIRSNITLAKQQFGEAVPLIQHPQIRSAEACYRSTAHAVELAHKYGTRLHVLHLSTAKELSLFDNTNTSQKNITAEACVPHLWFDNSDYARLGTRIKCNPAIKTAADRLALREALTSGKIDTVATDHAPHLWNEKQGYCLQAASGMPSVQFSLTAMLELCRQGCFSAETVVEKMCHAPARLFRINRRGFIRKGYFADLVLIDPQKTWTVAATDIESKCGWSPFEGTTFSHQVVCTFVNGKTIYRKGEFAKITGKRLTFNT